MSTKFLSPGWRMPRNANQSKSSNYSLLDEFSGGIDLGTTMNITGNLSISGWFKPRGTTVNDSVLVGKHLSTSVSPYFIFIARINSSGGVEWRIGTDTANPLKYYSVNSTTIVRDSNNYQGDWFHFTGTWDGVNIKIYINGVLEGTTAAYGNLDATTGLHTSIAALYLSAGSPVSSLNGASNNVSFFDYALSASQVTTLWGGGTEVSNPMALPRTPIAYYPLGESAGGFVGGSGTWLTENNAIGDYVFDFPTSTDAVQSDFTLFNGASEACISAWFKTSTQQSSKCLFSSPFSTGGNRFDLYLQTNGFSSYLKTVTSTSNIASSTINYYDDKWHNVIVTYDGVNHKIYYDGNEVATAARSGALATSTYNKLEIGRFGTSFPSNVDAEISNVLAWTKGLTPTEVETLYNYGSPIQTLANIPQNSNLKAWYKLDATEIYNSSSTEWSIDNNQNPSSYPSSLNFNGSSNYIDCGTSLTITRDLTLSGWVNFTSTNSSSSTIISKHISGSSTPYFTYQLYIENNGAKFRIGTTTHTIITGTKTNLNDGKWHHILGTYDGSNINLYVDGVSDATAVSVSGDLNTTVRKTTIGGVINGDTNALISSTVFDGELSNTQIFNTALPETGSNSIETIYNNGTPLADMSSFSSLVSWWKLNNTTTGIQDSKGTNNGTNNGATEYPGFVNALAGDSSGMSQSNLVQSDLQTVAPYSKYAMSFDGTDYIETLNNGPNITKVTLSAWIKRSGTQSDYNGVLGVRNSGGAPHYGVSWDLAFQSSPSSTNKIQFRVGDGINAYKLINSNSAIPDNTWTHVAGVLSGTNVLLYINGTLQTETETFTGTLLSPSSKIFIGAQGPSGNNEFVGSISNPVVWNTGLSASEVREIYNEGLPSDLNTFSGTAPVAWWQLGENSSYVGGWTFADEIASNNGTSGNLPETALTNGVGTTANGTSTGMSEGSLVGDAPYSTANAISSGMAVTARGTDVPPTP